MHKIENMAKPTKKSDGKEKNKMCVGYFVKGEKIVKRERLEVEDDTNLCNLTFQQEFSYFCQSNNIDADDDYSGA